MQHAIKSISKTASWPNTSQQNKNDIPECFHGCRTARERILSVARKVQFICKLSQTQNYEQY